MPISSPIFFQTLSIQYNQSQPSPSFTHVMPTEIHSTCLYPFFSFSSSSLSLCVFSLPSTFGRYYFLTPLLCLLVHVDNAFIFSQQYYFVLPNVNKERVFLNPWWCLISIIGNRCLFKHTCYLDEWFIIITYVCDSIKNYGFKLLELLAFILKIWGN